MTDFVDVAVLIDPKQIGDGAVDQLQRTFAAQGFSGWTVNDASLEAILIYILATWAADIAQLSAQTRLAVFRAFGTKLLALPYQGGAAATVQSTWTLTDTVGHTIPGGTFLSIADLGFQVQQDVTVPAGSGSATGVSLVATDVGTAYNALTGPVALVEPIDWVSSVSIAASGTSGGANPETDDAYTTRLAGQLALQAPRPITATDYAQMALSVPSTVVPAGVVVGRATALDGWDPSAHTFTASTTNASPNLTAISSFTGLSAGSAISGSGIPAGTYMQSVNTTAATGVMTSTASATATGVSLTATGSNGNERAVTTFVTDGLGNALSSQAMSAIQTWLAGFREINFNVSVLAPSYTTIYVTCAVHALPGYDTTALASAVQAAILNYLSPAQWGNPLFQTTPSGAAVSWLSSAQGFATVRYLKLVGLVENVLGVDYVSTLTLGFSASPVGTSDLTLLGPAPLPQSTAAGVIVTTV